MCVVRHNISKSITLVRMNYDTDDLSGKAVDIFYAAANCCYEYKPQSKYKPITK